MSSLDDALTREKGWVTDMWRLNCTQAGVFNKKTTDEPVVVSDSPLDATPTSGVPINTFQATGDIPVPAGKPHLCLYSLVKTLTSR